MSPSREILVLEDNPLRIRWLRRMTRRLPGPTTVVWVRRVDRLVRILREQASWDLLILDHDLGTAETGTDAARQMDVIAPIVIWSLNPSGAERMRSILEKRNQGPVYVLPFGSPELSRWIDLMI